MNMTAAVMNGVVKCKIPYGIHARISRKVFWCLDRILLKFAPYTMFSRAGSTRTQIWGLHSDGINLDGKVGVSNTPLG